MDMGSMGDGRHVPHGGSNSRRYGRCALAGAACRRISRLGAFATVGVVGFAVQLAVLRLLTAGGTPITLAAGFAVLAALAHNFAWHSTWTWSDRRDSGAVLARFWRFVGLNGTISLAGNVAITSTLSAYGVPVLVANVLAVAACSVANFVVANRWVFALAGLVLVAPPDVQAAELSSRAIAAWNEYVRATEARIDKELRDAPASEAPLAPGEWERVRRGEIVMAERRTSAAGGEALSPPGAMIHHWRARAFLPGVQLDALLAELQAPTSRRWIPPDVLTMRVSDGPAGSRSVTMRIARGGIMPVTYDTEHRVDYARHTPRFASSRSVSTRIVEIAQAGTPREHRLPEGRDHGFLWRLNAYWRYTQIAGGVLVECESLSLSRDVPMLLRAVATPIIDSVSRDSLRTTLAALRNGFAGSSDSE